MNFFLKNVSVSDKDTKNPQLFRISLTELEEILPSQKFMRISKNSIINLNSIKSVKGEEINTDYPLKKKVTIGDKWKAKVDAFINRYKRKQ